ncbi:hypothetical protein EON79_04940 [bacterium]|nr:MAG: hypothetical protein EON79_04940 [bacterium]
MEQPFLDTSTPAARAEAASDFRAGRRTGKSLIGMPVVTLDDGERKGTVHDVVYSAQEGRLLYLTVPVGGSLFGGGSTLLLDAHNIRSVGADAITVDLASSLVQQDRDVRKVAEESGEGIVGKKIMTEDGDNLGTVVDVLLDVDDHKIVAYEVSGGIWSDLMRGQTDVPASVVVSIGKDVIVVPNNVKAEVERPSGGFLGFTSSAQEKLEEREADYALGKVSGSDVTFEDGMYLVRKGDRITEEHVRNAMLAGKIHALAAAAGFQQAGEAWDATKAKASELGERVQEKQGELLVGRTTGRSVVDDAGMVIVPEAKVVDELDVDKARAAGKLNDLTLAVAKKSETQKILEERKRSRTYAMPTDHSHAVIVTPSSSPATFENDPIFVETGRDDVTVR